MLVNFNTLPDTARLWIYMSDKEFSTEQATYIHEKMNKFCTRWNHHKNDLKSSYELKYNRFIILAVDESYNEISGCSINKSIKLMKKFENKLDLDLMNRLNTGFKENEQMQVVDLSTFKEFAKKQKINRDTIVFNNLAATKEDYKNKWEVPASESWHARFIS